jgi:hypothetical protein
MVSPNLQRAYVNMLVFSVVSGLIALGLVAYALSTASPTMVPFVTAFVLHLAAFIAIMLVTIARRGKALDAARMSARDGVRVDVCPDYYSKVAMGGSVGEVCSSEHMYTDPRTRKQFLLKLYPNGPDASLPSKHIPEFKSANGQPRYDKFQLSELTTLAPKDKCDIVFAAPTDPQRRGALDNYHRLPWTTMRSRCNLP